MALFLVGWMIGFMVFNATFNNIIGGGHHRPATDKLYHIKLYTSSWAGVEPTTSVVIGTNCIESCKSNYYDHNGSTGLINAIIYVYV